MALEAYNLLGQKGIKGERNPDPNLSDSEATYLYSREPGGYNSDNQGLTTTRSGEVVPVDQELHNKKLEDAGLIPLGSLTGRKTYTGLRADDTNNSEPTQSDNTGPVQYTSNNPNPFSATGNLTTSDTSSSDRQGMGFLRNTSDNPNLFNMSNLTTSDTSIKTLTNEEFKDFRNLPIAEKLEAISRYADGNIFLTTSQKKVVDETYDISNSEIKKAEDIGKSGVINIDSGPLDSGVDTWWQLLGYESLGEVNRELASGALTMSEVNRAKDDAEEKRGMGGVEDTRTTSTQDATVSGLDEIVQTVTLFKDGKTVEVLPSDVNLYLAANWTANETASSGIGNAGGGNGDNLGTGSSQEIVTSQVIVLGPNGARTTANSQLSAIDKERGETRTELERLLAGDIPGREGYKDADKKSYVDIYGEHTTGESVSGDYKGDYGGEDASTPDSERESSVGAGNTGYDTKDYSSVVTGGGQSQEQILNPNKNQFNNIPEGADLVDVEGQLFLRYAVPGAGSLYQGSTIFMFYEVRYNDPIEAGFVTPGQDYFVNAKFSYDDLDLMGVIAGNSADLPGNDPATNKAPHPFTSFAENLAKEATIQPWILDPDSVALIAEAALEGREVTRAEWFSTNWYKTHNEAERSWLEEYTADPLTATQKANDYKLQVASALKAAGVSGGYDTDTNKELAAPDALSGWIANKWVTGEWSESYTTEQLALFADPFRNGVRDSKFSEYIDSGGVGGLNRTAEQEDRVRGLYTQWLGPVFGSLTDAEVAEKAGRIRNNPDYEAALVESLKTSRLALFPKHTNTELTYDDIVSPYRGITRQIWGQEADETQGWWQDMVATNDYESSQTLLREKGLEQNVGQVTVEATRALQEALGGAAGSVETNLGVNQ